MEGDTRVDRERYDVETDDDVGTLPYCNAFQTGLFSENE